MGHFGSGNSSFLVRMNHVTSTFCNVNNIHFHYSNLVLFRLLANIRPDQLRLSLIAIQKGVRVKPDFPTRQGFVKTAHLVFFQLDDTIDKSSSLP